MNRFAESPLYYNTTTETRKTKAKLKFILVEMFLWWMNQNTEEKAESTSKHHIS